MRRLRGGERVACRAAVLDATEGERGAGRIRLRAAVLRRLDRLAVEPRPHLLPLPAPGPVAGQQAAQQQRHVGVESLGQRHALRQGVNQERALVDTIEAGAAGELLQEDDAEAPPVGRRRHAPEHGLGRHVARRLARRDHIQIELGEARGAEAGDDEIGGVGVAELDDLGPEIAMPQPDAGKPIERPSDRLDDVAQGVLVVRAQGQVAQARAVDVLDHLVRPARSHCPTASTSATCSSRLWRSFSYTSGSGSTPRRVERQHAALAAVHALDEVALGRTDGGERLRWRASRRSPGPARMARLRHLASTRPATLHPAGQTAPADLRRIPERRTPARSRCRRGTGGRRQARCGPDCIGARRHWKPHWEPPGPPAAARRTKQLTHHRVGSCTAPR